MSYVTDEDCDRLDRQRNERINELQREIESDPREVAKRLHTLECIVGELCDRFKIDRADLFYAGIFS